MAERYFGTICECIRAQNSTRLASCLSVSAYAPGAPSAAAAVHPSIDFVYRSGGRLDQYCSAMLPADEFGTWGEVCDRCSMNSRHRR